MKGKQKIKSFIKKIIPSKHYLLFRDLYIRSRYFFLFPLYIGNKVKCPFCKKYFRKFLSSGLDFSILKEKNIVGAGHRLNVICPRCRSTDRERLIYLYIKNKINLFQQIQNKINLLHIAPERNLQKIFILHPNIKYFSIDLNSPLAMIKMDITDIKFKGNSFDIIICCHVLEHILDDQKAMSELYRILKPKGWAILQVPISPMFKKTYEDLTIKTPKEKEKIYGQNDHVRIYGQDYSDRLIKAGFNVKIDSYAKKLKIDIIKKYGINKDENIFFCQKIY